MKNFLDKETINSFEKIVREDKTQIQLEMHPLEMIY